MNESTFIHKASDTPLTPPTLATGPTSLPADLLADARKRLGWAGLIYAGTYTLAHFGPRLFVDPALIRGEPLVHNSVAILCIVLGLAVFYLTHRSRLPAQQLLNLGLVFEVIGALGIAVAEFWGIFPEWNAAELDTYFIGIPWECAWIILFPLLAPNTVGKSALAAFGAASMGPLTVLASQAAGLTSPEAAGFLLVPYFAFTTYLCAILAVIVSWIVLRYGARLKRAQEIGSYELLEPLGIGGMGEVWAARHRMLARPAAVKLIRAELLGANEANRGNAIKRFEREARATAALRSEHTIDIYDYGVSDEGAFFYVMELLDGVNLETLVKRFGPVEPGRVVFLLEQVCNSLSEAHENGLIHRDIKPANIYTCRQGPDHDFVKVLDFGLVKSTELGESSAQLTAEGVTAGTPAYMAPEMALEKRVDGRADIYSIGCVAYWLLTGQHVFQTATSMAAIVEHVRSEPVPPSQRTELPVPDELERVILSCLAKDPADRPQTAEELGTALARSVPADAWTRRRAREWWNLHLPAGESSVGTLVEELSPQRVLEARR